MAATGRHGSRRLLVQALYQYQLSEHSVAEIAAQFAEQGNELVGSGFVAPGRGGEGLHNLASEAEFHRAELAGEAGDVEGHIHNLLGVRAEDRCGDRNWDEG